MPRAKPKKKGKPKKRKSQKRVKSARRLAKKLPRDERGRFLPAGSKNLFKKKRKRTVAKRTRKKAPVRRKMPSGRTRGGKGKRFVTVDEFPNYMSGSAEVPGSAEPTVTTSKQQIFTPLPRLKVHGNLATVLELLYLDVQVTGVVFNNIDDQWVFNMRLGAEISGDIIPDWADTRVFVNMQRTIIGSSAIKETIRFFAEDTMPYRWQFQTEDGYGYLLAADSFRITAQTRGLPLNAKARFNWKLYYRFVEIPLAEFIGIIQSTQTT